LELAEKEGVTMNEGKRIHPRVVDTTGMARRGLAYDEASLVARSSVRWGSIFAGAFVALLSYLILMALGLAIGGHTLSGAIGGDVGFQALGIGAAVWLVLATLVSLFLGGYGSGRVSGIISTRVGRTQGAVLASIFFLVLTMQAGGALGTIGAGVGNVIGAAGRAAPDVAQDERVQQTIQQAMGDLDLRSPPDQVAQGLAIRLLQGDTQGARNYLAAEAGISQQEAQVRIDQFRTDAEAALADAGETAAQVMQAAGWTLFFTFLLGGAAAVGGGHVGTRRNLVQPIDQMDEDAIHEHERAA